MEIILAVALVSWTVVGLNLLFTYDEKSLRDAH